MIRVRTATPEDAPALDAAQRGLALVLGDPHNSSAEMMAAAMEGPSEVVAGIIAEADGTMVGAAVISPLYSSVKGGAGGYVSDLWVSEAMRGSGLGTRMLSAAAVLVAERWGGHFLSLAVHDINPRARGLYERLGFTPHDNETKMTLHGTGFAALSRGETG